jgi:hypothetical protein
MANGKRDAKAPAHLTITVTDSNGKSWGTLMASAKDFSTGSVGFYGNGKLFNPASPASVYQCGLTFTLIGSKG